MTDREMLELAARAAGVCLHPPGKLHTSYGNWGSDTTCTVYAMASDSNEVRHG